MALEIINNKYVRWGLIALGIGAVLLLVLRYLQCRKRGKDSKQPYRCKMFNGDPDWMDTEREYYMMRERKCYHVIDFGDNMSIRRVGLEMCGMREEPKKSDVVEEVEYF